MQIVSQSNTDIAYRREARTGREYESNVHVYGNVKRKKVKRVGKAEKMSK